MVSQLQDNSQHGTDCPISNQPVWLQGRLSNIDSVYTQWDRVYRRSRGTKSTTRRKTQLSRACRMCKRQTVWPQYRLSHFETYCVQDTARKRLISRHDFYKPRCASDRLSDFETDCTEGVKATKVSQDSRHKFHMLAGCAWDRLFDFKTEKACVGQVVWCWDKLSDIETDCVQDKACMGQTRTMFIEWQHTIPHKQDCVSISDLIQASP